VGPCHTTSHSRRICLHSVGPSHTTSHSRRMFLHSVGPSRTTSNSEGFAFTVWTSERGTVTHVPLPKNLPSQPGAVTHYVPLRRICLHSVGPCHLTSHAEGFAFIVGDRVAPNPTQCGTVLPHVPLRMLYLHSVGPCHTTSHSKGFAFTVWEVWVCSTHITSHSMDLPPQF